ncbi:hypothetical protein NPIL_198821 [Nephila pilipes]|uniref:Uncharacterized protein n=1 Tax=Nephila pilipes TaxID=299642 RepID=A0A8X6R2F4_NEPPI|nr:hypothetical protein NPIL_198821 [Nephila pilipes]
MKIDDTVLKIQRDHLEIKPPHTPMHEANLKSAYSFIIRYCPKEWDRICFQSLCKLFSTIEAGVDQENDGPSRPNYAHSERNNDILYPEETH